MNWALWQRQIVGILRLELRKNLFSTRAVPIYLLAAIPVAVIALFASVVLWQGAPPDLRGPGDAARFFVWVFLVFLRVVVYFGCAWSFMNLFRGEILDGSLHYYFLAPIRREVLVAGKFLSAIVALTVINGLAIIACFTMTYAVLGDGSVLGPAGHLLTYIGVVALGCLGYGAVFMLLGQLLRNPVVPAIVLFGWESILIFLPGLAKKITVMFYLQSMLPVPIPVGAFAVMAEPPPAWQAVPGLLIFSVVVLLISGRFVRGMEISYATD